MGNEVSAPNNNNNNNNNNNAKQNNNTALAELQKQILENQLKIQNIQIQNLQNGQFNNNQQYSQTNQQQTQQQTQTTFNIKSLLSNPELHAKIANNPELKQKLLTKILTEYHQELTQTQLQTIKSLLGNQPANIFLTNRGTRDLNNTGNKLDNDYIQKQKMLEYEKEKQKRDFLEKQKQRKLEYERELQGLNMENINSMRLFNLQEGFTYNDLKKSYKRMAIQTHPDRPKGSKDKFQVVTKCYFMLLEKLKTEQVQPEFSELKNTSRDYWSERAKQDNKYEKHSNTPDAGENKRFNVKQFNKVFEDNKLYDPSEEGYDEWLKNDDEAPQPQVFSNKFNINVFNNSFDDWKENTSGQEIMEYKEPEALQSSDKLNCSSIDTSGKSNFTKTQESTNDLLYCDLKSAYTNNSNLINTKKINVKTYKNIDDYEIDRNDISYQMTPHQIKAAQLKKKQEDYLEQQRLSRISERDSIQEQHYNRMHQKMLGNAS